MMGYNKYRAKKTTVDGVVFDSMREAKRYSELKILEGAGKIFDLRLQPSYDITINGQKICKVILDFDYTTDTGQLITEDVKGGNATRTPVSRLKKKMVEAAYGIEVRLV